MLRPWKAVLVMAAILALALLAGIGTAVFAAPAAVGLDSEVAVSLEPAPLAADSNQCMVARFNETKPAKVTSLGCTSNDVQLAQYTLIAGPSTCVKDDNLTVTLRGEFLATASERWDVGVFVGLNGTNPNSTTNSCYQDFLHYASSTVNPKNSNLNLTGGSGPFYNGEVAVVNQTETLLVPPDTCGDIQQGQNAFLNLAPISIKCQDTNNDGVVDVPTCTVWNNQADLTAVDKGGTRCTSALDVTANTTAKCTCGNVPVAGLLIRPGITTSASGPVTLGSAIHDTATLSGATANAGGSITFTLYGPTATASCTSSNLLYTSPPVAVNGNGSYTSGNYTPAAAGSYYWIASYSGDAATGNAPAATQCGDSGETSVINKASPSITTTASPTTGTVGVALTAGDTATFSGGSSPTGSVTFTLYSDNQCTSAVSGVSGSGAISAGSASYSTSWTPPAAGTYYWKASYPGDANNNSFTTGCGGTNEEIVIGKASPTIATQANPTTGTVGVAATFGDTATLSGGFSPTGSVTFTLYSDSLCAVAVSGVSGSGTISAGSASYSTSWTPPAAGTYRWKASYPGDSNNNGFTTGCGDANEQVVIGKASPSISTAQKLLPNDKATLSGLAGSPIGGSVTFKLFSPSDATCSGPAAFSETVSVTGNGDYSTNNISVYAETVGTWRWLVEYSGDSNNTGTTSACGVENFTITNSAP